MKMFVTVLEESFDEALAVIESLITVDHDGIEVRAERFTSMDLHALRASTQKPLILTYRGSRVPDARSALEAGIDFVDVEWRGDVEIAAPDRTVLSHHDYEGMREIDVIATKMRAFRCAYTKVAATPHTFADNERLLALPASVIGMGERGLYARILAPFRGSEITFVAAGSPAAPSQLTLPRALEIFGEQRRSLRAERVFAVVGNPAGHSLSPSIHNRMFREKGVSAAYTIASVHSFGEVGEAFLRGEPCGLSVTAPFKNDALTFAHERGAEIRPNAQRARAVNTLVKLEDRIVADNTDVDGFAALLPRDSRRAAVIGAGGTARAALVALQDARIPATVFNRTASKGDASLDALAAFDGDLIINTLPSGVDIPIPPCRTYIEAAYGGAKRAVDAAHHIDGLALLHAQARRQHELFMEVFVAV